MRRSPNWLRALGNTGDGVFVVDAAQRIIYWSKGAERLLGYPEAEVLNRRCHQVIAGRMRDKVWCRSNCDVRRSALRGTFLPNFNLLTSNKEGENMCVNVSIIALPTKDKPLTLHLLRDVTRQERSEEAMDRILSALRDSRLFEDMREDKTRSACMRTPSTSSPNPFSTLTRRELEVLGLLTRGLSTDAIAARLNISHFTVRNHVRNMLSKTGLHSKTRAVSFALRNGLL